MDDIYTDGLEDHWSQEHEGIASDESLAKYATKYESIEEVVKAGHSLSQKLGSSFRLPDDLTSLNEEQRAELLTKTASMRDVPNFDNGEDYEIEIPGDVQKDEDLISTFKAWAKEQKLPRGLTQGLAELYMNITKAAQEKYVQQVLKNGQEAETNWRMKKGPAYEDSLKNITLCRMKLADKLKLPTQADDEGNMRSALDDALDMEDVAGKKLGNHPAMLSLLEYVFDTQFAESPPISGSPEPGASGGGAFSDSFYDNPKQAG
jgi:hypothetical protein